MRYLAGYLGCVSFILLLMGLIFRTLVWPSVKPGKKHSIEWVVIAVFALGMFRSMAVKPGDGDTLQSPRRNAPQQTAEPSNTVENATTTNVPPWESTLAFRHIETTPSNVQLTTAWPSGFFNYDPILDLFIAHPGLTNEWHWTASQIASSTATNCTFTVTPSLLGLSELPPSLFARITERNEACEVMDDSDSDGVPNPFEFHHGTNPYLPDAYRIQTLDCTNASISALKATLADSTAYSIINLPTGTIDAAESICMPPHPVLLSGPKDGYTVIKSTADLGAFMFKDGQNSHTLIRNVYLDLLKRGSFQVGFWSGGNLPWAGVGASPSFENVVVRTPRPETQYIAWLYYLNNGETAKLKNCEVNAHGATNVRGVETGNGPRVDLDDCSFLNFPSNGISTLSRTFALGNDGTTNAIVRHGSEATVFVDLTPGLDSDGDGYSNIQELEEFHTDPWLADSDGDGIPDPDELVAETDPLDVLSFMQGVVIEVTNTTAVAGSQVYVSWEITGDTPSSGFLTNSAARSFFTTFNASHSSGRIRIMCYRDLDGDSEYDPAHDISLTQTIPELSEYTRLKFTFGDIDNDGISDLQERIDGTNPYSSLSLRITRTVNLKDDDFSPGITNYVSTGLTKEWIDSEPFHRLPGASEPLSIATNAISGCAYVKCFRDFNKNGVYDEDCEPLYVYSVSNQKDSQDRIYSATLKDKDGDAIPDSIEWRERTDLNDYRCYCYTPHITITGIFTTTNQLYAQPFFGTNALAAAHLVCTNEEEYCIEHLSTTNSERLVIKYWDDLNNNLVLDDNESFSSVSVQPDGHDTTIVYDLPYSKFDANRNRLPDWWEIATGLSTNSAPYDYHTDSDNDGLINLHEYWTGCDPLRPDGSNTVLSILTRSIDDRLTDDPTGRMNVYNNYYSPDLAQNTNCWAYGIDFSSASPYNYTMGTNMAGTAISSQHILLASHYPYGSNTIVVFKDNSKETITRTVIGSSGVGGTDLLICLLDTPLPPTITPSFILPPNYSQYIGNGRGLPILQFDQEEHAIVADLDELPQSKNFSHGTFPSSVKRRKYSESVIDGDSGDPAFLVYGDTVILLHTFYSGGGGAGPFTTKYAAEIQSTMNTLSNKTPYPLQTLNYFDFSPHPTIIREVK